MREKGLWDFWGMGSQERGNHLKCNKRIYRIKKSNYNKKVYGIDTMTGK